MPMLDQRMSAAMSSERTGSIQFWPVSRMPAPPAMTAAVESVSPAMWRKARAQVHVAGHAPEQRGDHAVHQHAGGGHDHHQPGLHGDWRAEAMDGFNADPERDDDERGGIDEGGQHAGALVAEGPGVVGGARLEVDGGKAEQEGEKIGDVVAGLREQRERVGAQAGNEGDHDVGQRGHQREAQHGLWSGLRPCRRAPRGHA